jgi:voltage-dependent potassium channel beta subunit
MEYRYLGKSGIQVSQLALGSWVTFKNQVNVDAAVEMMTEAYNAGVNFFDNAESYALGVSEEIMGEALKRLKWRRSSYLISSKYYWGLNEGINEKNTLNRKRLIEGVNGSLERFGTDYLDLIYCHRPDANTPIEETVWAMHNLIEWGKALYWGTSEWSAAEVVAAIEIAERHHLHKPIVEQPQYNLLHRQRFEIEYARLFTDYRYGATIWSPLASGLLTGKYNNGIPEGSRGSLSSMEWLREHFVDQDALDKIKKLQPIADGIGASLTHMSLAWCLKNKNVSTVILGASRVEQLRENLKAIEVVEKMTPEVMTAIDNVVGIPE